MSIMMIISILLFIVVGIFIALKGRGGASRRGFQNQDSVETYGAGPGGDEEPFDPATYGYIPSPRVESVLNSGNKIEAIKIIREETRLGLKEAKALCDYIIKYK